MYNYLSALESTFLISRVNRYDLHDKEILKTQEKFYLADQGILYSILVIMIEISLEYSKTLYIMS